MPPRSSRFRTELTQGRLPAGQRAGVNFIVCLSEKRIGIKLRNIKEKIYRESRIHRQRTCRHLPYSQALDLGNMVFVSGQLPVDPATGTMADTVEQQAAQSLPT